MISSSQRPLPDNTQHLQQTNIHAPGGIRTHNPGRRAAADLRLRPRGHWEWCLLVYLNLLCQLLKYCYLEKINIIFEICEYKWLFMWIYYLRWGDNIKMDLQEVGWGKGSVDLAQYRDKCRSVANAVTTFAFHKMRGIFWLSEGLLASPRRTLVIHLSVSLHTPRKPTKIRSKFGRLFACSMQVLERFCYIRFFDNLIIQVKINFKTSSS